MSVDERDFRHAMSHFASGVTIVSTRDEGKLYGMTVASFASLSLRPTLILVCIELGVQTHDAILRSGHFGVSVLAAEQGDLSTRFASKIDDRFEGVETFDGALGDPLISEALTNIECRLREVLPGGDHSIHVGEVVETKLREAAPLIYFQSGYRELR
jgi:flavin reductase (DIM6/NTAB) family NADH-FMN oxidoreductase RutF